MALEDGKNKWETTELLLKQKCKIYIICVPLFNLCREMDPSRAPLSEAEFEEIMNRNRAISSSAISRAVSDASAGNIYCYNTVLHC